MTGSPKSKPGGSSEQSVSQYNLSLEREAKIVGILLTLWVERRREELAAAAGGGKGATKA